jgi:uncharacterized protein YecE (DUF72 family)
MAFASSSQYDIFMEKACWIELIQSEKGEPNMKNVEMSVEGNILKIEIDLSKEFGPSSSGKTIMIASTEGNVSIPGAEEKKIGLNVYRKKWATEAVCNIGKDAFLKNIKQTGAMKRIAYDRFDRTQDIKSFNLRKLHPKILLGTASDRYAGWIGQIYTADRYKGRISRRTKTVGGKSFVEETLPVDSVREYFEHFSVLEIDYTFYSTLLDNDGKPSRTYPVLQRYRQHMKQGDHVVLKIPQMITAQKVRRGEKYVENETYLNPEIFTRCFYEPANKILGSTFSGMIFEQEYQRKQDRVSVKQMAEDLDRFFEAVPKDNRYHIELRTDAYLSSPVFAVLDKHGVGQVLSHWTWLPPLRKQLAKANQKIFNSGRQRIVRLMTPIGMRYEVAYAKAHPFDKVVEGMLQSEMVLETAGLMRKAIESGTETSVLINNRAGGNAPIIAQRVAEQFQKMWSITVTAYPPWDVGKSTVDLPILIKPYHILISQDWVRVWSLSDIPSRKFNSVFSIEIKIAKYSLF